MAENFQERNIRSNVQQTILGAKVAEVSFCALTWNRTKNSGLEVRSYIHLTMRADIVARIANLIDFE